MRHITKKKCHKNSAWWHSIKRREKLRFDGMGMGSWPMDGSINLSVSILDLSSPSSLSVSGSTKKREERGKMLQLNSVSRVSSSPQNPKLWLPQYNSLCSTKSISLNSKTSSTEKKKTLGVKCQYYDQQHKTFTTSSRSSPSSAPPGSFYYPYFTFD
jgi:hypothetical protein